MKSIIDLIGVLGPFYSAANVAAAFCVIYCWVSIMAAAGWRVRKLDMAGVARVTELRSYTIIPVTGAVILGLIGTYQGFCSALLYLKGADSVAALGSRIPGFLDGVYFGVVTSLVPMTISLVYSTLVSATCQVLGAGDDARKGAQA